MKKLLVFGLICLAFALIGCGEDNGGSGENGGNEPSGTLDELMDQVMEAAEIPFPVIRFTREQLEERDAFAYYLGTENLNIADVLVGDAVITRAFELALLRLEPGSDVNAAITDIRNGLDPWRWICVGIGDPDRDIIVEARGNLIVIIMDNEFAQDLQQAFRDL